MKNGVLLTAAGDIAAPITAAMSGGRLTQAQKMYLQRVLRSILNGFLLLIHSESEAIS